MIQYIESENIDRFKWDHCVGSSRSPLVYGYSWYLDIVSPGWCGIIEEDYSAVMPLPVKKKYGINYIIQPLYTQQIGIFSSGECRNVEIEAFVNAIPDFYRFIDMNLNHSNDPLGLSYIVRFNRNYELNLQKGKEEIAKGFSENTRRNIQKASAVIEIREDTPVSELVRLVRKNAVKYLDKDHYEWMKIFIENELCASVFLINYEGRIYYLIPVSNKTGKEQKAMFAIINYIIGKYAGLAVTLDFEGSNHEGVARFYAGFGAKSLHYPRMRINRLPFPYRLFIRH